MNYPDYDTLREQYEAGSMRLATSMPLILSPSSQKR